ncbi:MAG TPA: dienelactone hydrolase family protein [Thermoanaerobaculia bacterium]
MNALRSIVPALLIAALAVPAFGQDSEPTDRMEESPRHGEWVDVPVTGDRTVRSFVAYPESSEDATAVIVIHENRGLTDWVRSFADELAEAGYLAIAPDLLSGFDAEHAHTGEFESSDAAREAIYALDADRVTADLEAVREYAAKLPAGNGKVAVAGFCWGGSQTFRFATNSDDIEAAFVFYGTGPEDASAIAKIRAPVYGFYGGSDARVNATIPKSQELMKAAGKTYQPVVYEGAGHGFMRAGEDPNASEANRKARQEAWERWKQLLAKL